MGQSLLTTTLPTPPGRHAPHNGDPLQQTREVAVAHVIVIARVRSPA